MRLENTYVLILAGGIGSRFWPLSREGKPKQFLDILGMGKSLIRICYERYAKVVDPDKIFVIANVRYKDLIKEHIPELDESNIMSEPMGRNTAPCVAYATHKFSELSQNATMVVAPSDHMISDEETFYKQLELGVNFAKSNDVLVTLGLKPHRPDTGYGYIQYIEEETEKGVNKVKTFTEKPPLDMAQTFLESGDFLWNSGMFIWSLESISNALKTHLTEMDLIFAEGNGAYNTNIEYQHIERIYSTVTGISIDNGLLEKADNVYVLPSDFGWSDLGTWKSVAESIEENDGNRTINVIAKAINSSGNLLVSNNEKLVVIKDIYNLFIVDTDDALLICPADQEQEIKKIATQVKKDFKDKYS